jgi:hypothetical protein
LHWQSTRAAFRYPSTELTKHGSASLYVVRADGRAGEPVELNFRQ